MCHTDVSRRGSRSARSRSGQRLTRWSIRWSRTPIFACSRGSIVVKHTETDLRDLLAEALRNELRARHRHRKMRLVEEEMRALCERPHATRPYGDHNWIRAWWRAEDWSVRA